MRFNYKRYPEPDSDLARPVIPITLYNPRSPDAPSVGYFALVDSGADFCAFSREIANMLEIDVASGELHMVSGAVSGETRPVYFHPIEVGVGPYGSNLRISLVAGFMVDLSDTGYGLLGRRGFFDAFSFVKFRDAEQLLDIGKRR